MTTFARPEKESHLHTIFYEIEMLGFCYKRINTIPRGTQDHNAFLECYLLHYRNLIAFFSGENHKGDDLSTHKAEIWAGRQLTQDEAERIKKPSRILYNNYWKIISQYLQHCTERRITPQEWNISSMHEGITPIINEFQKSFPQPAE